MKIQIKMTIKKLELVGRRLRIKICKCVKAAVYKWQWYELRLLYRIRLRREWNM